MRELKLLVDHRDDLVAERTRAQQRLRWNLYELEPALQVPVGGLDRTVWLDRLGRRLARSKQTVQTMIARELVGRCRTLTRTIRGIERELAKRTTIVASGLRALPGCGPVTAAKLLGEIGPIDRFDSDAQLARHAGVAPLEASSGKHQRHRLDPNRRQEPPRSPPLPQTTPRPHHLHHHQKRAPLDIGATLGHATALSDR